jgi:hypothetical protein
VAVDADKTVFRIDLDELGISPQEWVAIAKADPVKIVSNTSRGKLLRTLLKKDVTFFHFDNFNDIVLSAPVYHALTDVPPNFAQFTQKLGVDFAGDLKDGEALISCINGSSISASRGNRMIASFSSDELEESGFYVTFDPVALGGNQQRNCFQNPLLAQTGSQRNFEFNASESINLGRNNMLFFGLWAASGNSVDVRQGNQIIRANRAPNLRQDFAPLDIVADNVAPVGVGPTIRNASSCFRCHNAGLLPYRDELRSHVQQNAAEFNAADFERVLDLYEPQREVDEHLKATNAAYARALQDLGINPTDRDPINEFGDQFKLDWTLKQAASFFFLSEQDFCQAVNQSAQARAQIGNLCSGDGAKVTQEIFLATAPQLIKDARLFEDPID